MIKIFDIRLRGFLQLEMDFHSSHHVIIDLRLLCLLSYVSVGKMSRFFPIFSFLVQLRRRRDTITVRPTLESNQLSFHYPNAWFSRFYVLANYT